MNLITLGLIIVCVTHVGMLYSYYLSKQLEPKGIPQLLPWLRQLKYEPTLFLEIQSCHMIYCHWIVPFLEYLSIKKIALSGIVTEIETAQLPNKAY